MNLDAIRGLSQPNQRTCGPSSLVAARMLVDAGYAPVSFPDDVLALHRQLTAPVSFGRFQLPWPRALGTPPWAAARAMTSYTGLPYRTRTVRLGSRSSGFAAVQEAVSAGHPCPLYVGSAWVPRHVVLAVGPSDAGVQVYNPGRGAIAELARAAFTDGPLTTFGSWTTPWFALVPASS